MKLGVNDVRASSYEVEWFWQFAMHKLC